MKATMKNITYEKEKDLMTSEKYIEKYLQSQVSHLGGIAIKYFSPFRTGYPDRLVMLPKGHTIWVELKSTGKKPTKLQLKRHEELRLLGQVVYVCDSKASVDELIEKWKEEFELPQGRVKGYDAI